MISREMKLRTVDIAALSFVVVAIIAFGIWFVVGAPGSGVDQWAPNIAIEALSIAATIEIVDRIVASEERRRVKPRLDAANREIVGAVGIFLAGLARKDPDFLTLIERVAGPRVRIGQEPEWVRGFDAYVDRWIGRRPRTRPSHFGPPNVAVSASHLRLLANSLVGDIVPIADRERSILPSDVVAAIDDVGRASSVADLFLGEENDIEKKFPGLRSFNERMVVDTLATAAQALVDTMRTSSRPQWREVQSQVISHVSGSIRAQRSFGQRPPTGPRSRDTTQPIADARRPPRAR